MTGDVSDSWDEDFSFSGDLRISDSMSRQNEMLNAHLQQVRSFSRDTKKLDEILTDYFSENDAEILNTNDCVLKALDLVALANEDRARCSVFKTRLGKSYLEKTTELGQFYPTLKFLGQSVIRVDGDNLPRLCGHTGVVLRCIEAETSDHQLDSDWDLSGFQDRSTSFIHDSDIPAGVILEGGIKEENIVLNDTSAGVQGGISDGINDHATGNLDANNSEDISHVTNSSADLSASASNLHQTFDQMLVLRGGDTKASDLSTENLEPATPESFDFMDDFPNSDGDQAYDKPRGSSQSAVTEKCDTVVDYLFASQPRNKQELNDSFTAVVENRNNIHNDTKNQEMCQQADVKNILKVEQRHKHEFEHEPEPEPDRQYEQHDC